MLRQNVRKTRQRGAQITKKQRYANSMRDGRIYEKPTKGVHQIPNVISIARSQGYARMCAKHARGVYKSSRKSGTPIP